MPAVICLHRHVDYHEPLVTTVELVSLSAYMLNCCMNCLRCMQVSCLEETLRDLLAESNQPDSDDESDGPIADSPTDSSVPPATRKRGSY
jgi:hypothetical protein